jgi:hypothetical protein
VNKKLHPLNKLINDKTIQQKVHHAGKPRTLLQRSAMLMQPARQSVFAYFGYISDSESFVNVTDSRGTSTLCSNHWVSRLSTLSSFSELSSSLE